MKHLFPTLAALTNPALIIIAISLLAMLWAPQIATLLDERFAFEKVFQKTGLALLLMLAIYSQKARFIKKPPNLLPPEPNPGHKAHTLLIGWILGIVLLLPPLLVLFYLDIRLPDLNTPILHASTISKLLAILFTALLVASIEEFIFRAWLLDYLRSKTTESLAIICSAMYFALLHFLKAPAAAFHQPATIADGWTALLSSYQHLLQFEYPGTLLALFFAGWLLALIKLRYRSLLLVIGIHAGWVFSIKSTKVFSNSNPATLKVDFLVGQDGIIGYLTAAWLCVVLAVLLTKKQPSYDQHETVKEADISA